MYPVEATMADAAAAVGGIVVFVLLIYLLSLGFGIAMYILQSLGVYTIAERRGIKHPWMAWLPVANVWILGSISDQYRYVARGQVTNRRKVLLGLQIALMVTLAVVMGAYVGFLVNLFMEPTIIESADGAQILSAVAPSLAVVLIGALVTWILCVIALVFQYIACYDLYASCNPDHAVLFTVFSILVNVTMPFFIFACRKKDLGMPPRKDASPAVPPVLPPEAPAEPRVVEEPWEN